MQCTDVATTGNRTSSCIIYFEFCATVLLNIKYFSNNLHQHIATLNPRLAKQITSQLAHPVASYSPAVAAVNLRLHTPSVEKVAKNKVLTENTDNKPLNTKGNNDVLMARKNNSTVSLASMGSQGEGVYPSVPSAGDESDFEDSGLLLSRAGTAIGSGSISLALPAKPVAPASSAATGATGVLTVMTAARTPTSKLSSSSLNPVSTTTPAKGEVISSSTAFDSLFAAPSEAAHVDSPLAVDPTPQKMKTSLSSSSLKSAEPLLPKSAAVVAKPDKKSKEYPSEKKLKNKKRKVENGDDIDDIFGF